jgi:hypothetical protein
LILGVILIAAFIVWETRYPYAMIPMTIWRDRDFSLVSPSVQYSMTRSLKTKQLLTILSTSFLGFPVLSFWIALYFQTVLGYNALMTGVHMLPMVVVGVAANWFASNYQHKISNKLLVGIGAAALTISFVLAASQRYGDSYWAFSFPALCLCVIGVDFQFVCSNVSELAFLQAYLLTTHRCTLSHRCP